MGLKSPVAGDFMLTVPKGGIGLLLGFHGF